MKQNIIQVKMAIINSSSSKRIVKVVVINSRKCHAIAGTRLEIFANLIGQPVKAVIKTCH